VDKQGTSQRLHSALRTPHWALLSTLPRRPPRSTASSALAGWSATGR
jgi:hypothetical protein